MSKFTDDIRMRFVAFEALAKISPNDAGDQLIGELSLVPKGEITAEEREVLAHYKGMVLRVMSEHCYELSTDRLKGFERLCVALVKGQ